MSRDALEALLDDAMEQVRRKKTSRMLALPTKPREVILRESFQSTFAKPENWREHRTIALVHRAEDGELTLLGAFKEFLHRRLPARKLVRIEAPSACEGEEIVSGPEWFGGPGPVQTIENPEGLETREVSIDISLRDLDAIGRAVRLTVSLIKGLVDCAKLAEPTQFSCIQTRTVIFMPAGLKILDGMTLESKMTLRRALELRS